MESDYNDNVLDKESLNINEAAKLLQCSTKTVRNKIKRGEILATLVDSPYGKQYSIDRTQFEIASTVVDVVQVPNELKLKEFGAILSSMLAEQNGKVIEEIKEMKSTIENLQYNNNKLLDRIEKLEEEHFEKIDLKLIDLKDQLEERKKENNESTKQKNWFSRLFERS